MNESKSFGTKLVCVSALNELRPLNLELLPDIIRFGDQLGLWEDDLPEPKAALQKALQDLVGGLVEDQKSRLSEKPRPETAAPAR
jgi:hypothetical protein